MFKPSDNISENNPAPEQKQDLLFWVREVINPCAKTTYEDAVESLRVMMQRDNTVKAFASASSHAFLTRSGANEDDIYG
ncbi:MAG: hypothetical protein SFV17_25285 [Candidatus Obscuribacter sp.]|nr:hypothetical protein [Candidatus Obscuribacter sp.]